MVSSLNSDISKKNIKFTVEHWLTVNLELYLFYRHYYHRWLMKRHQMELVAAAEMPNLMTAAIWNQLTVWIWLMMEINDDLYHLILSTPNCGNAKFVILCSWEKKIRYKNTFSHPSGGRRAKNRFIRGDASDDALSSGEVLWLSSVNETNGFF